MGGLIVVSEKFITRYKMKIFMIFFFLSNSIYPNSQNERIWAIVNPHVVDDVKRQGTKNYMCSVMFLDGRILEPFWFVDEEGKKFNCNQDTYLACLVDHFLPQLTRREKRTAHFQQDGQILQKSLFAGFLVVVFS